MANAHEPVVSVIIPVFNRPDSLIISLESVYAQKFQDFEVIVVDDGSVQPLNLNDYPNLKIIRHHKNRGAAAARNTGMSNASGRFIAFLDSDDVWAQGKLDDQLDILKYHRQSSAGVFTPFAHQQNTSKIYNPELTPDNWFEYFLMGCRVAPGSTLLIRKSAVEEIGLQDESLRYHEDWDWLLRAAKQFCFAIAPNSITRIGPSGRAEYSIIMKALMEIERKWTPRLSGHSLQMFKAALEIERAAGARWHKNNFKALKHTFAAFGLSPKTLKNNLFWKATGKSV